MSEEEMRVVDSFVIGGTNAGPSMPGVRLQQMLGTQIFIDVLSHKLHVPTLEGTKVASKGDRIILYDDGTLDVEVSDREKE